MVEERLALRGDADQGSAPVVGVGEPGHQALALEPLTNWVIEGWLTPSLVASVVSHGPSRHILFMANAADALKSARSDRNRTDKSIA